MVLTDKELQRVSKNNLGVVEIVMHTRNYLIIVLSHLGGLRSKRTCRIYKSGRRLGSVEKVVDTLRLLGSYTKGNKHHRDSTYQPEGSFCDRTTHQLSVAKCVISPSEPTSPLPRSQKGKFFSPNSMVGLMKTIYEDAGFSNASSHSGRRKFATTLIEQGADLNLRQGSYGS